MMAAADLHPATERDAVDGVTPSEVRTVRTTAEIVDAIADARARRAALVARGGGTLLDFGNRPRELATILALDRMDRILDRSPDDMVVTLQPGVTLAALDEGLKEVRQRSGLSAWSPGRATVGGIAATGVSSSLSYGFGFPRDQVLGLEVADGAGRCLRCGGRVVKNVAGYDLPRLFVGSVGTLGVITELTIRTHPLPDRSERLAYEFPDAAVLERARSAIFRSHLPLASFHAVATVERGRPRWRLQTIVEGTNRQVEFVRTALSNLCGSSPDSFGVENLATPAVSDSLILRRIAAPSDAIAVADRWITRVAEVASDCRIAVDCVVAGVRLIVVSSGPAHAERLVELSKQLAGAERHGVTLERVPVQMKESRDVWGPLPAGIEIMRRLKARFDPDGVLAPGRFVGRI